MCCYDVHSLCVLLQQLDGTLSVCVAMGTSCYSLLRDVPTHIANGAKDIVVMYTAWLISYNQYLLGETLIINGMHGVYVK